MPISPYSDHPTVKLHFNSSREEPSIGSWALGVDDVGFFFNRYNLNLFVLMGGKKP